MHIQWRLAGGKNRDEKGSDDDEELVVPAIALVTKGGEKKRTRTPTRIKHALIARRRDTWKHRR